MATTDPGIGLTSSASPLCSSSGRTGGSCTSSTTTTPSSPASQIWRPESATRYWARRPSRVTVNASPSRAAVSEPGFTAFDGARWPPAGCRRCGRGRCAPPTAGEARSPRASPIRHPVGVDHGSPAAACQGRSHRYAAAAANSSSPAEGGVKSPTRRSSRPVSRRPAATSGSASRKRRKSTLVTHAEHRGLRERTVETPQRRGPVGAVGDHLGQHRVVVAADHGACGDARIDPHTGSVTGSITSITSPPVGRKSRAGSSA